MTRPPRASTEAELQAFERVCEQMQGFGDHLPASGVDGWLTVLAAGPVQPGVPQWLPLLFGDDFDRAFADPDAHAQALQALRARLAVIRDELDAEALLDDPESLRLDPLFDEWTEADRDAVRERSPQDAAQAATLHTGCVWAEGALEALAALVPLWSLRESGDLQERIDELVAHVEALCHDPQGDAMRQHADDAHGGAVPDRDQLLAEACFALQDLRVLLLDHGPRPAPRRVGVAPGRNDPCSCGSGLKFKKCHGRGT